MNTYVALYIALIVTIVLIHQIATRRKVMATFSEVLTKIDEATTAAGDRVAKLIASIKAGGATLTAEQQTEADAIVSHLTAIGADETNPVPPAEPTAAL